MHRELSGTESGLVGYWQLNEGIGDTAFDKTANGNHGSLMGGIQWVLSNAPVSPLWLTTDPDSGIVIPSSSVDININFDATGLAGGDYEANIIISSNDPINPEVSVPVNLHVTSAPDISVSDDTLNYGQMFIGASLTKNLVVYNSGYELLTVSNISSSNQLYTINIASFTLHPGEAQEVEVTFAPTTVGNMPGILTINSNDPYEPTLTIELLGEGVTPPVISVSPNSLSENLLSGKKAVQTITINNSGGSDLNFDIRIGNVTGPRRLMEEILSEDLGESQDNSIYPSEISRRSHQDYCPAGHSPLREPIISNDSKQIYTDLLTRYNLNILLITSRDYPTEIQNLLLSFPDIAVVDIFDAYYVAPTLNHILSYDAAIVMNNPPFGDPVGLGDVLADYADAGGGVILTIASFASGWEVQGRFLTDGYIPFNIGFGPAGSAVLGNFNASHPIMYGVTTATGGLLADVTVTSGAELIAEWNNSFPFVATKGRNVAAVNIYVTNSGCWTGDIPQVLHNAVCWSIGAGWISAEPSSGTVPANSSMDISITFDAAGMSGGSYSADVIVASNDPVSPEVTVPAQLNVTDAPAISVTSDTLNFGEVFLGLTDTLKLVVENKGSMDLLIFSAVVQPAEYSIYPPFAGIDPGETEEFTITFSSQLVGNYPGTLIFSNNDPELGNYQVVLSGQGVEPPVILVSPSALNQALRPGQTATQTITISNAGGSNLYYEVLSHGGMQVLVDENFNSGFPSSDFTLYSDALYDSIEGRIYLTKVGNINENRGGLFYNQIIQTDITKINFDFEIGGGSGADGLVLAFLDSPVLGGGGGDLGFFGTTATGWGVEFDTWANAGETENHVAVIHTDGTVYITNDNIPELENTGIFSCEFFFYQGQLEVYLENVSMNYPKTKVIEYTFSTIDQIDEYAGFTASTGGATNNHCIDNLVIAIGESWLSVQPDSGIVPMSQSGNISVFFNATSLDTGEYDAYLNIETNDPILPQITVPVHLCVSHTVGIEQETNIIKQFRLCQNYPNPFNPTTIIEFDTPKTSQVILKIFNILGEEVATLVSDRLFAGSYSYEWNASNLASGVYLYRLQAGDYIETRKMVLMK